MASRTCLLCGGLHRFSDVSKKTINAYKYIQQNIGMTINSCNRSWVTRGLGDSHRAQLLTHLLLLKMAQILIIPYIKWAYICYVSHLTSKIMGVMKPCIK